MAIHNGYPGRLSEPKGVTMTMRPALPILVLLLALATHVASGLAAEVDVHAQTDVPASADAQATPPPGAEPLDPVALVTEDAPIYLQSFLPEGAQAQIGGLLPGEWEFGAKDDRARDGPGPLGPIPEEVVEAAPPALAAAGLLALLQAFGAFRFAGLGAMALYSRLANSDLLDNEHRDKVYRLVQQTPGLGLTEICKESGLGWGTTVYHLDRLERAQMVASERVGMHRCYFPMGTVPRQARKGIGALKTDTTRSIAQFLVTRPGASQTEVCEGLGLSASAASKQITKLEGAGLVRRERDGKTVRLYPADDLQPLLGDAPALPARHAVPVLA